MHSAEQAGREGRRRERFHHITREIEDLKKLADDGLVEMDDEWIHVTPRGRLLVRAVCMVFDRYLREAQQRGRYSRVM